MLSATPLNFLLGVLVVSADQYLKALIEHTGSIWQNAGGAFSLSVPNNAILAASILIISPIILLAANSRSWLLQTGLTLIIAGGASNTLDRWQHGAVTDILLVKTIALNLADVSIICGTIICLYYLFKQK